MFMKQRKLANPVSKLPPNPAKLMSDLFSRMSQNERESVETILISLLDDSTGLGMKTDLEMPLAVTRLEIIAFWGDLEGATDDAKTLREFSRLYKVNRVSHDRQSREEIVKAVSELHKKEDRTLGQRLSEVPT